MFNIEEFDIKLDTEILGRNFVYIDKVDSTNSALLENKDFNSHGCVLFAEFQKKGRGRKDREWASVSDENLTFSILLNEEIKSKKMNLINFCSSLSVAQAIENLYQLPVTLKWPNDVLVNNKKIAGILLESVSKGKQIEKLVIGIGVNVNQSAFPGTYIIKPTGVRSEFKQNVKRERLLSEILNILERHFEKLDDEPDKILEDWRSRCPLIGEKITIADEKMKKYGIFEDIDEEGFLILRSGDYTEKIAFGDMSLLI